MACYFDDAEKQKKLKDVLDSWLNTPFRHRCGVKGKGCDCIHFVGKVLEEMGVFKWRKSLILDYPRDWHLHRTKELLMDGILRELNVEKVEYPDLKNGDICLFRYGRASAHAALYFDRYFYQSITDVGVRRISSDDSETKKRMTHIFRVKACLQDQ
ncbi:MAG: hypothetical protein JXB42_01695 [Deltaproteobacteria bacterium]|nr:hypothetical protein [Deltaproteobacteria bacterium]